MTCFDIFNGDADGICALIQLRRAAPRKATLVTGPKRDIALLDRVPAQQGDEVTVLDISMRTNHTALERILTAGARVFYVDHHNAGDIPSHPNLTAAINTRPDICTGLLINKYLDGAYREWAVMAAFGDNLTKSAKEAAKPLDICSEELARIQLFGELVNYNGYGRNSDDLHFAPDDLYRYLSAFDTPRQCLNESPDIFDQLKSGYETDFALARQAIKTAGTKSGAVYILEDAAWARRISGSFGNSLAQNAPQMAHAVLTHNEDGSYLVSVRAPKAAPEGADSLCLTFKTGGGRAGAAGINRLPAAQLEQFLTAFHMTWPQEA